MRYFDVWMLLTLSHIKLSFRNNKVESTVVKATFFEAKLVHFYSFQFPAIIFTTNKPASTLWVSTYISRANMFRLESQRWIFERSWWHPCFTDFANSRLLRMSQCMAMGYINGGKCGCIVTHVVVLSTYISSKNRRSRTTLHKQRRFATACHELAKSANLLEVLWPRKDQTKAICSSVV